MKAALIFGATLLAIASARADDVRIGGAGASAALAEALGAAYERAQPQDRVEVVRGLGSGGGVAAAADGVLHIVVSSRDLKPEERARGLSAAPFLETPFVFASSHPRPQSLAREDVAAIFDGRKRAWPDGREIKPILRPRSDSVTPWLAAHLPGVGPAMEELRKRPEVPVAATDHDAIQMAEAVPGSFAPATLVQLLAERPRLLPVAFDGVQPSLAALEDGRWRDVFRLWIVTPAQPDAAARRFLVWLETPEAVAILRDNGARPAPRGEPPKTN